MKSVQLKSFLHHAALAAFLLFPLSCPSAFAGPGQSARLTVVPDQASSANAMADGIFDAGAIDPLSSQSIDHTFQLENDGKSPVVIDDLTSSCGCTTALLVAGGQEKPLPVRVAPGQSVGIQVKVDLEAEIVGSLEKFVWVHSKDQDEAAATLEIKATMPPLVVFSPATLDFGRLRSGDGKQMTLYAVVSPSLRSHDLQLSLASTFPYLAVSSPVAAGAAPAPNGMKGEWPRLQFTVTLQKSVPISSFAADLQAEVRNPKLPSSSTDQLLATVYVVATGKILGDISSSPSSLVFGTVKAGQGATRLMTITADSFDALSGLNPESDSKWVNIKFAASSDLNAGYVVSIDPSTPGGALSAKITFTTKHGQTLTVPVIAYVAKDDAQ